MSAPAALPTRPRFAALPPLALYVHVPWCIRKCPYCDFNSHEAKGELPEDAYVDALLSDLEFALPSVWGGGSSRCSSAAARPASSAPPRSTACCPACGRGCRLRRTPKSRWRRIPARSSARSSRASDAAGVNRLSLGIQSFDPVHLRALGRVHDEREARAAAEAALAIFGNVNFDLMYALPRQTIEEARADAAAALAFGPPHLSFYQLTLEPNTLFHRHPPPLPDEDAAADIEDTVHAMLAAAGYVHYETSAFARPGSECRHNLNYWRFGDYLGIGAGAHSKLSFPDRIVRQVRWRQPKEYLSRVAAGTPLMDNAEVSRDDIGFEFMLNALRLTDGVPAALFAERTGYPLALVARGLEAAAARELIEADPAVIRPTALGRRFLNDLQSLFLAEPRRGRHVAPAIVHEPVRDGH